MYTHRLDRLQSLLDLADGRHTWTAANWQRHELGGLSSCKRTGLHESSSIAVSSAAVYSTRSAEPSIFHAIANGVIGPAIGYRRENTTVVSLMYTAVTALAGSTMIALDHATLTGLFADSVSERWRRGEALIPRDWL